MNDMLQAALAYAERGLPVFPCSVTKAPLTANGVTDATTNPDQLRAWWAENPRANIGLNAGAANLMVLDLDPGHDVAALDAAVGGLPPTLMRQRTPRGGEHLFYALGDGEVVAPSASKLSPHVDVRSLNSYVLLAPSVTADGTYRWESEGKPAFRTDEMVRVANSGREKSATRAEWIIKPDLPENIALAEAWLAKDAKVATEGQGGDHAAYATAAMMRSFGLSEEAALDCMWRVWNPRCDPPWTADNIEHLELKIANGYAYCTSDPGNITPAYRAAKVQALFKPVAAALETVEAKSEGLAGTQGRFRFAEGDAFDDIVPPKWLIDNFLPEGGYGMLVGAPGTCKSFIALDIGLTIAAGICDSPVWEALSSGHVLYAAGEGRSQIPKRVAAWQREHYSGARVRGFVLADPIPNAANDDDWRDFIGGAKAVSPGGYKLVIIDTVGRAMAGMDENSQADASRFSERVLQLQRELGCAVLALHHTGHDGKRGRGSSVFPADVDTAVLLERDGKAMSVSLRMTKQKDAEEWQEPRQVGLVEVVLSGEAKSLVPVPLKQEPRPDVAKHNPHRPGPAADIFVPGIVDRALVDLLATNPTRLWSTKDVAEALAMRPEVRVASNTLRQKTLVALREDPESHANKAYCPETKKWAGRRLKG